MFPSASHSSFKLFTLMNKRYPLLALKLRDTLVHLLYMYCSVTVQL